MRKIYRIPLVLLLLITLSVSASCSVGNGIAASGSNTGSNGTGVSSMKNGSAVQQNAEGKGVLLNASSRTTAGDVEIIKGIEYGKGGKIPLCMDVLRPLNRQSEAMPVIVWIHGGGWSSGSRSDDLAALQLLAKQGYIVASIDYRLSYEAPFPAQLEDCRNAVSFLRSNAKEIGLDAQKIGVAGASAGGHLAALLGVAGDEKGDLSKIKAVCDLYGPTDLTITAENVDDSSRQYAETVVGMLLGGVVEQNREKALQASPVHYVKPGAPPFLILHGDEDHIVPLQQSRLLYDKLKAAGNTVDLQIVKGAGHGFDPAPYANTIIQFFDKYLK